MDFVGTIVVYDIKVGRLIQLNEYMNLYEYQRSRSFIDPHPRSRRFTFSNFFCSETSRPIEAKFHMEPPWDVKNENLFKCSRSHDHAHIWWKTSKIFFFGTKGLMTLKLGMQDWVLKYYQCFHMMTLGCWPWPFYDGSNLWSECFCIGESLYSIECSCIYFQVCSNSAYPNRSGEQYRPVVLWFILFRIEIPVSK